MVVAKEGWRPKDSPRPISVDPQLVAKTKTTKKHLATELLTYGKARRKRKYPLSHRAGHVGATTHWGLNFSTTVVTRTPGHLNLSTIVLGQNAVH